MIIVSVVSGTYNRLGYLKQMVESVRSSVGNGIGYEIVIVDGGSKDGTIQWCKEQSDIRLIEHGKLLGAVRAFNDGARASRGVYVILANDDIQFINNSISNAIRFMQDNNSVGIGCFYQDRYNQDWHVGIMTAQVNGKSTTVWYGQVCIVPKWLGNTVGWWGDYLRTYGGDNELSCNVLEYGYKVLPIPCACIHDLTPDDELRQVNNPARAKGVEHPDTAKWLKKWTRNGKLGPVVSTTPKARNLVSRYYRILYAPIYEPGWGYIQKVQKVGLRKALMKKGLVVEVDWMSEGIDAVLDAASEFSPDIVVTQIQDANVWNAGYIKDLKLLCPNTILVNWNGDYHKENLYSRQYILMMKEFHHVGLVTTQVKRTYDSEDVKWFYWQIGYEESHAIPDSSTPKHDITFLANGYSDGRIKLAKFLRSLPYNVGIYGSWPDYINSNGNTLYDFDSGQKIYMNSVLAIGDNQWGDEAAGFVSNRMFQAMSAGVCYMQQNVADIERLLKLKDKTDFVLWKDMEDLESKIHYYMSNQHKAKQIATTGKLSMTRNHSFDARVAELWSVIR